MHMKKKTVMQLCFISCITRFIDGISVEAETKDLLRNLGEMEQIQDETE